MRKTSLLTTYPALNIQWPISKEILDGSKTVETRTYPIPAKYLGKPLLFIETPGKKGDFKARVVGEIIFSKCFEYKNRKMFYADENRHKVTPDSAWKWSDEKPKWGWEISRVRISKKMMPVQKNRGIIFCNLKIDYATLF